MISLIVFFSPRCNIKSTNVLEDLCKMIKWRSKFVKLESFAICLEGTNKRYLNANIPSKISVGQPTWNRQKETDRQANMRAKMDRLTNKQTEEPTVGQREEQRERQIDKMTYSIQTDRQRGRQKIDRQSEKWKARQTE